MSPSVAQGLHQLKMKAQQYYEENGVPEKVEDVLNSMFYDDPKDVYGHLVSTVFDLYFVIVSQRQRHLWHACL